MFDVIVVGGGPAGLSAALTLGRVRRSTLVVDAGEPRNAPSPALHNFLSRDGAPPAELRAIAREQLGGYPSVRFRAAAVARIERRSDGSFAVEFDDGDAAAARRLLLATGLADDLPPIPGLEAAWGRFALHCPYCHGYEVRDSPLAVLGATADRARLALHLTRLSGDVVLCTHGAEPPEPGARGVLEARGVRLRPEPISRIDVDGDEGIRIVFANGDALRRRAIFVHSTTRQRSPLAASLGCRTFDDGIVEVDDLGRTSVPGVYAAGDMARRAGMPGPAAAIVAAAASGAIAGTAIDQELVGEEFAVGAAGRTSPTPSSTGPGALPERWSEADHAISEAT